MVREVEKYIPQNLNLYKYYFSISSMKSIKISEKNWKTMMKHKINYGYVSIDEIIEKLLAIIPANNLKKEENQDE